MKKRILAILCILPLAMQAQTLRTGDKQLDDAFRLAVRTVDMNTADSLLKAGSGYGGEWTRDISINSWNAASLLRPDVARFSLWSVTVNDRSLIGHQYWDKIIWTVAAWNHYLVTGDRAFLEQAYPCSKNTMAELEEYAYERNYGLFMGAAVFQDGIAGYDEPVFDPENNSSYVLDHKNASAIKCLSTNCTYYMAYRALAEMAEAVGDKGSVAGFARKADRLKNRIRHYLYDAKTDRLAYLVDHRGVVHHYNEALGIAFAGLSGLVSAEEMRRITDKLYVSANGIPCVYPIFPRYSVEMPGRHNAMIWPFVNAFYADAAQRAGQTAQFEFELRNLARLAMEKGPENFQEIYNMTTGEPDGGWQCDYHWDLKPHQTWSATGYLRLFLLDVFGMEFRQDGLYLSPCGLDTDAPVELTGIAYRNATLDVTVRGKGSRMGNCLIDGKSVKEAFIPATASGKVTVDITLR